MYKKIAGLFFITALLFTTVAFLPQNTQKCNIEEALKLCKKKLYPFTFQDRKTITFMYKPQIQEKEYEVQLFNGEDYRFVFNRTYAKDVSIKIYDKPKDNPKRKLIYTSENESIKKDLLMLEPKTVPYLYIDIIIPVSYNTEQQGCVTLMIGYDLNFVD